MKDSPFRIPLTCPTIFLLLLGSLFAAAQGPAAEEATRLSEQTVYVPYDKLEEIFEKEGRGVFLPYKEFIELWTQLTPALGKKPPEKPPVDGVLVAAEYQGRVEGKVALIDARLEFKALKEGFTTVPLGADDLAISEAKVTGSEPAAPGQGTGEAFLATIEGKTAAILPGPGTYYFSLQLMVPVIEEPGRKKILFKGPKTSVSRFQMAVPEENLEFDLQPAAAYTQEGLSGKATRLSAFFGASNQIEIAWKPKRVEADVPAVFFAEVDQHITFSETSIRSGAEVNLQIQLAGLAQLRLVLPREAQVLSVSTPNLKSWDVSTKGDQQTVVVQLYTPARNNLSLSLAYEIPVDAVEGERSVPMLRVEGARRQSGNLHIYGPETLELRPGAAEGLTQESIPQESRGRRPRYVYRYLKTPWRLVFQVTRTMPQVDMDVQTLVQVGLDKWVMKTRLDFEVKKGGLFSLALACPEGFGEPEIVGAETIVEDYRTVEAEEGRRLEINMKDRLSGKHSIQIRTERTWKSPETEQPVSTGIALFQPIGVDRIEGYLGISVHASLAPNIAELGTTRAEDVRTLRNLPSPESGLATDLSLGFRYRGEATPPTLTFQRRKPRVSATALSLVEVREAFLKTTTTLAYQVDYAGVDEFSFQVPASIADEIHITGDAIKERTKEIQGDLATWKVTSQNKRLGRYELTVEYESPYAGSAAAAEETSKSEVEIPPVIPRGVFRQTGYFAILRDGNLEATPQAEGLEAIDNKELPAALQQPGVFLAYKYDWGGEGKEEPWKLLLSIVRHAYVEVPASIVNLAKLRTVVTEEGHQTCEVIYYLQNKRAQYLELELPEGARILSEIFVGETAEQPSRRESDGKLLVHLPGGSSENQTIPVRLVYEITENRKKMGLFGSLGVVPPQLGGTKVLQAWWDLYLPDDYHYPRFKGPMREQIRGIHGWHRWRRVFDWAIPNVGIKVPASGWVNPQMPSDRSTGTGAGLNVRIVEEGKVYRLHRLAEPATVIVKYRKRGWSVFLEILAFVVAVVVGVHLTRRLVLSRLSYCVTAGVIAVLLSVLVAPRAAGPYRAFYLGVFLLAVVWAGKALYAAWRNRPRHVHVLEPIVAEPSSPPPTPPAPSPEQEPEGEEKNDE